MAQWLLVSNGPAQLQMVLPNCHTVVGFEWACPTAHGPARLWHSCCWCFMGKVKGHIVFASVCLSDIPRKTRRINFKLGLWIGHGIPQRPIVFGPPQININLIIMAKTKRNVVLVISQKELGLSTPNLVCGLVLGSPRSL